MPKHHKETVAITTPQVAGAEDLGEIRNIVGFHIRLAHGAVYRHFTETFADLDLTQKQVSALWLVADHPDIAQTGLAQRMHMDRATTMAIVNRLEALDGFDVLSISFASPGIAHDWGIDKATLGWVLSMELLGMALGSLLLGGVADKAGRRPTILGCLLAMAVGMFAAADARGVSEILPWRLLTGLGIGGTLASINAAAAELSNRRWRNFALALMVIGYPLGGVAGGLIVQKLLAGSGLGA